MTAVMVALAVIAAIEALVIVAEAVGWAETRRTLRSRERWIREHFAGSGAGEYEQVRADDHRGGIPATGVWHRGVTS